MFGLSRKRVGLALSGGAARGFAHIGVIKVLQANDVTVDCVAGTSVGSIVGALFCGGYSWKEMREVADSLKWNELVSPTLSGMGLVTSGKLEAFIGELLGDIDFNDLRIPLRVVAADIARPREVVISDGSVARAVRASSAVPGIFEPLVEDDTAFVDGGVINNLPCEVVREMGAQKVIGVDLNHDRPQASMPVNLLDVSLRSFAMLLDCASEEGREDADILIQPDLTDYSYHDLSKADDLVRLGEEAAHRVVKQLRRLS